MNWSNFTFRPQPTHSMKGYDSTRLLQDVSAGVTVDLMALALAMAMAFAIASGVTPEAGIFTGTLKRFRKASRDGPYPRA